MPTPFFFAFASREHIGMRREVLCAIAPFAMNLSSITSTEEIFLSSCYRATISPTG
jgi:hypothetical protein